MPDISMCKQEECPKSWYCWRFNAPPDKYRQSYMAPEFNDDGCEHFWDMDEIKINEAPSVSTKGLGRVEPNLEYSGNNIITNSENDDKKEVWNFRVDPPRKYK